MKKIFKKIFKNKKKILEKKYLNYTLPRISEFHNCLKNKSSISFLHYGHLGDLINSLPVIKEISKNKDCYLYIQKNKSIPEHVEAKDHSFGSVYLNEVAISKMLPLLKEQKFLKKVEVHDGQEIDIDLNFLESFQ